MIHLINRRVFFKIYFLKIIFVDSGVPAPGVCSRASRIAIGHVLRPCPCVYVLWTGFSQSSLLVSFLFLFLFCFGLFFFFPVCTVLYCKRDFSRDFSLWDKRTGMLGCLLQVENPSSELWTIFFQLQCIEKPNYDLRAEY